MNCLRFSTFCKAILALLRILGPQNLRYFLSVPKVDKQNKQERFITPFSEVIFIQPKYSPANLHLLSFPLKFFLLPLISFLWSTYNPYYIKTSCEFLKDLILFNSLVFSYNVMEPSGISIDDQSSSFAVSSTNHTDIEPLDLFPSAAQNSNESMLLPSCLHGSMEAQLNENRKAFNEEKEDVTVALHIGLPNYSRSSNNSNASVAAATRQYWIPTPEQILIGFTHFSCHVCFKTFNRYNNLQVHACNHCIRHGLCNRFLFLPFSWLLLHLFSNMISLCILSFSSADAHVGSWITVSERARITEGNAASGNTRNSMLLLCRRVQEQHRQPEGKAAKRFSNITNTLQKEAWAETFYVSQVWQILGC